MNFWHLPVLLRYSISPKQKLRKLFLSGVARRTALQLLSIFSPVYIYQIFTGLGFSQQKSFLLLISYFILVFISKLLTLVFSEDLSRVVGFKGVIHLSALPFLIFTPLLIFADKLPILLLPAAVLWGMQAGFFWWGYHGYFVKAGDVKRFGRSIGEAGFLETVAVVMTPLIGAAAVYFIGYYAVFILAAIFIFLTIAILGEGEDLKQKTDIEFKQVAKLILSHKSTALAYMGNGAEGGLYIIFWPLILYLFYGGIIDLGIIISASSLLSALFAIAAGDWVDKKGVKNIITVGTPLVVASWILRFFSAQTFSFVTTDTLWNFGQRMVTMPLNVLTYRKATEPGRLAASIMFREVAVTIGPLLGLTFAAMMILVGLELKYILLIAAVFSLFPFLAIIRHRIE